ncbi:4-hydroxy-tetrahydrodipicolinate synthase [Rubripirellula obstinata]|uniref:4-hydroxy-tetrahydrodipicolinate synthase n=1 Tax=Rubripirellula obstinata TaxID=406547 RepID=A0A5B1CE91_9BACT|nr:4-hydroxy-tetrahydrodipicolinate synthase [Rubripirellula obstinata]KAA1259468.1 4-hydroxy-tetrahydrodipicolinate synthase [Rubripirellula obstinata]
MADPQASPPQGARKGAQYAGLSVAITTPFSGDQVDYDRLREQIEFQIDAGTTCIVPAGTTGESPTLSHDEHDRLITEVVQCVAGRVKVMAGTGSNSTAEALRLTKRAADEGIDATLQVAPYYNKPTQEGLFQHFKAIAEHVDIPVCVYNIPGRTAKEIDVETIQRLSDVPGIAMVKEATGKLDQCSAILGSTDLTVLSGDDSLTLPMISVGAEGVISVVGNVAPGPMLEMVNAALAGDFATAQQIHHRMYKLCSSMLGLATNPIPIKAAMQMVGRDSGQLRLPMTPLDESQADQLREVLFAFGLQESMAVAGR